MPSPESLGPRAFFTIGYGGRPPEEFIGLLHAHGVRTVADVRIKPERAHMGAYTKAKTPDKGIEKLLADAEIGYRSLPELGNVFLDMADWTTPYAELIERAGELLTRRLVPLPRPFCLLCAEKRVAECHRRMIADHLVGRGWSATHIE